MITDYEYYGYTYMISAKLGEEKKKEFKLNLETAKEFYFLIECNTAHFFKNTGTDFYKDNFTIETLLSWNDEFILSSIEQCKKMINNGLNNKTFIETFNSLCTIINIYTTNKDVLRSLIEFLEFFINKVGYFIFFRIYSENFEEHTLYDLWRSILETYELDINSKFVNNNLTSIAKFHNADREGLIPNLLYQGYNDLIKEFVERIMIPMSLNYNNTSKTMVFLNLRTGDTINQQLGFYVKELKGYFEKHNVILSF